MDKLLTHRKFIVFTLIFNPLENTKYQHPSKSPGESFDKTIPKNPLRTVRRLFCRMLHQYDRIVLNLLL